MTRVTVRLGGEHERPRMLRARCIPMIRIWWRIALVRYRLVQPIVPASRTHANGFANHRPACVYSQMNQLVHLQ